MMWLVDLGSKAAGWGVAALAAMCVAWIAVRFKDRWIGRVLTRAVGLIEDGVIYTKQVYVDSCKALAPDGKLTVAQAREAFSRTKTQVLAHLGSDGLAALEKALGIDDPAAVMKWIEQKIEGAVSKTKAPPAPPKPGGAVPLPLPPVPTSAR